MWGNEASPLLVVATSLSRATRPRAPHREIDWPRAPGGLRSSHTHLRPPSHRSSSLPRTRPHLSYRQPASHSRRLPQLPHVPSLSTCTSKLRGQAAEQGQPRSATFHATSGL
ncbi:hypothetical protein FA09DRAFT_330997 [Tilletiopsis washingtonensis]|uniref:Uncharacterized protein n=1 Tax=Tilletiopsis washingtonensis TaxID=58919 RepID=A0A316Z582_9BASI|nr:hypothetical protein FA09DRAFT_330997 [Tilletiopsis washingtonensis]PWN96937.1 hypothetical protein FA09DRAFT_330997 [Tilletiopsis washingtonensis]